MCVQPEKAEVPRQKRKYEKKQKVVAAAPGLPHHPGPALFNAKDLNQYDFPSSDEEPYAQVHSHPKYSICQPKYSLSLSHPKYSLSLTHPNCSPSPNYSLSLSPNTLTHTLVPNTLTPNTHIRTTHPNFTPLVTLTHTLSERVTHPNVQFTLTTLPRTGRRSS